MNVWLKSIVNTTHLHVTMPAKFVNAITINVIAVLSHLIRQNKLLVSKKVRQLGLQLRESECRKQSKVDGETSRSRRNRHGVSRSSSKS